MLYACGHVCPKTVFTVRDKIIKYLVTPALNSKQPQKRSGYRPIIINKTYRYNIMCVQFSVNNRSDIRRCL